MSDADAADVEELIKLFNRLFAERFSTYLVRGGGEPIYLPAGYPPVGKGHCYHRLVFAHGHFSSALHEIAHWCIAGEQRRQLVDFGYWYEPDGRSPEQQREFEKVEVKPQALEWIFSVAAKQIFHISVDNLTGEASDVLSFKRAVHQQAMDYCQHVLPTRAAEFRQALCDHYKETSALVVEHFDLQTLR